MSKKGMLKVQIVFWTLVIAILVPAAIAEMLYVDGANGNDVNPGTEQEPLKTIGQAAAMVNSKTEGGPTTIKVARGVYNLTEAVLFENTRPYTKEKRLTIEAAVLPDDPNWKPVLMPVVLSTEIPQQWEKTKAQVETSGLKIEISHVTICGLKFLGNPVSHIWYYPIFREGKNLEDLLVTQCLFAMNSYALSSNVAIIANGHGLVVDHCIFYNCRNPVVFWNAEGGTSKNNAMRYCIVDGAYTSGLWVCQTAEDFEFHHNIITRSRYAWMRDSSNQRKYRLRNCIITDNEYYSGECGADWKLKATGSEIIYEEKDVIKMGKVVLEMGDGIDLPVPKNFLHPVSGTLGSDLGAGLFVNPLQSGAAEEQSFIKETYAYKKIDGHEILADVYRPKKNEVRPVVIYIHGWYMADSRHGLGARGKALLNKLIEADYAVVSIDFRLAPETKLEQMIEDVKDACIWVRERGPELFNVDPNKVAVMGGSSGGTLAFTAGYILKNPPQVVVAISGPADLEWAGKSDGDKSVLEKKEKPYDIVGDKVITVGTHSDRYKLWPYLTEEGLYLWELLGFEPELEPDRFNALLPIKNFTPNYPPTLLVRSQGEGYADLKKHLDAKNIENEQFIVPDVHSIKIIGKYTEAGEKIVLFLDKHLK